MYALGVSLVVQCLGLCTFTPGAWVQSLVGELRSHKLHGGAETERKKMYALIIYFLKFQLQKTLR